MDCNFIADAHPERSGGVVSATSPKDATVATKPRRILRLRLQKTAGSAQDAQRV